MKRARVLNPFALIATVTLASALLTGCTDSLTAVDEVTEYTEYTESSDAKLRNSKFLSRAYNRKMGSSGSVETLGLIFKVEDHVMEKNKVVERYKVIERNKTLERYKVMERYEYDEVFSGWAITVEDTSGMNDFDAFIDEMGSDPDIAWFEPDFSISMPPSTAATSGSGQEVPWSVAQVGATDSPAASGDGTGSVGVDVYVLDSGVSHSDINVVESIDFRGLPQADAGDYDGHGTHVAGIAAAKDNTSGLVGVAPGARVHNYKVLNDDGKTDVSVVIAAVEHITQTKLANPSTPMVVNMSIGENLGGDVPAALDDAVRASIEAGVIYVVSAGNDGDDASHVTPAKVPEAITVGALDFDGYFSGYSNWGPRVDILAPGTDIVSLGSSNTGSSRVEMSGTSMSAAHVTGAVALYLSDHPSASPAEVEAAVVASAKQDVMGTQGGTTSARLWVGEGSWHDNKLLFVLPNALTPSGQDAAKKDMFESFGYDVEFITALSLQAQYDAALTDARVVFISEETNSGDVGMKLSYTNVGVVSEEAQMADEFGIASDKPFGTASDLSINGVDHYITQPFSGTLNVFSSAQSVMAYSGTMASGKQVLANWPHGGTMVVVNGGDQTYSLGAAAGRRVQLPWGGSSLDINKMTADGQALLERAIDWAAGEGDGGVPVVTGSVDRRISSSYDDAEERTSSGSMYMDSSDLELISDGSREQLVGMRFTGVEIPQGAKITNAYIQFKVDETNSGSTSLTFRGQDAGNAAAFTTSSYNLSSRSQTAASASWQPAAWNSTGATGSDQRTPSLNAIVQEIVDRGDWTSGNAIAILVSGSGERTAESYNGDSSGAPLLHVDWTQ